MQIFFFFILLTNAKPILLSYFFSIFTKNNCLNSSANMLKNKGYKIGFASFSKILKQGQCHKLHAPSELFLMDGQTDQPTDWQSGLQSCVHVAFHSNLLKNAILIFIYCQRLLWHTVFRSSFVYCLKYWTTWWPRNVYSIF